MKLVDYSLQVGNILLIEKTNLTFGSNLVNHLLGSNGAGKSCFAKSCIDALPYSGEIIMDSQPVLIGSYSNIPLDLTLVDITHLLQKKYSPNDVEKLCGLLNFENISQKIRIRKLSDGQRQKIKLLCFLITNPKIVIFDEFTSALDKNSALELYKFINEYITSNNITCINITHNLSDIEYMPGNYYFLSNKKIKEYTSKDKIINDYIRGR